MEDSGETEEYELKGGDCRGCNRRNYNREECKRNGSAEEGEESGVGSVGWRVWGGECGVESVGWRVWGGECGVEKGKANTNEMT